MNDLTTIDAWGELSEPATLRIQRLLPARSSGSGPISPKATSAGAGSPRAR